MVKVSVIIPNWNGKQLLDVCLSSLVRQSFKDFEVIVVDNGSVDGSQEFIQKKFPDIKLINLDKNYGFAYAVNRGVEKAKGKFIVLLNNDTKAEKNCLKELVICVDKNLEVGMVAAKMLNYYNPKIIDSAGDFIDAVGHADNIGQGEPDGVKFQKAKAVFLVSGGGCLIKKIVFEKVGLFDEDFFAYFEDVDFGFRAQLLGIKAIFCPKAIIYHIHKATSSKNPELLEYLQFRNMTQTVIKNFPTRLLIKNLNWLRIILVNLNTVRFLAKQGYLKEALLAEIYILKNIILLLKKRRQIQSQRQVDVEYIIDNVLLKKITLFGLIKNGI